MYSYSSKQTLQPLHLRQQHQQQQQPHDERETLIKLIKVRIPLSNNTILADEFNPSKNISPDKVDSMLNPQKRTKYKNDVEEAMQDIR